MRGAGRRFLRRQAGAAIVEAAVAVPVLLMALLLGIELVRGAYFLAAGHNAVNHAARVAMIGAAEYRAAYQAAGLPVFTDWIEFLKTDLAEYGSGLGLPTEAGRIEICPVSDIVGEDCSSESAGAPGQIVRIRWRAPVRSSVWRLVKDTIVFDSYVQNEPFA